MVKNTIFPNRNDVNNGNNSISTAANVPKPDTDAVTKNIQSSSPGTNAAITTGEVKVYATLKTISKISTRPKNLGMSSNFVKHFQKIEASICQQ